MSGPNLNLSGNQLQGLSAAQLQQLNAIASVAKGSGLFEGANGGKGIMGSFVDSVTGQTHYIKMLTNRGERTNALGDNPDETNLLSSKKLGEVSNSLKDDLLKLAKAVGVEDKVQKLFNSRKGDFKDLVSRKIAAQAVSLIGNAHNEKAGANGVRFDWKAVAYAGKGGLDGNTSLRAALLVEEWGPLQDQIGEITKKLESCEKEIEKASNEKKHIEGAIGSRSKSRELVMLDARIEGMTRERNSLKEDLGILERALKEVKNKLSGADAQNRDKKLVGTSQDMAQPKEAEGKGGNFLNTVLNSVRLLKERKYLKDQIGEITKGIENCEKKIEVASKTKEYIKGKVGCSEGDLDKCDALVNEMTVESSGLKEKLSKLKSALVEVENKLFGEDESDRDMKLSKTPPGLAKLKTMKGEEFSLLSSESLMKVREYLKDPNGEIAKKLESCEKVIKAASHAREQIIEGKVAYKGDVKKLINLDDVIDEMTLQRDSLKEVLSKQERDLKKVDKDSIGEITKKLESCEKRLNESIFVKKYIGDAIGSHLTMEDLIVWEGHIEKMTRERDSLKTNLIKIAAPEQAIKQLDDLIYELDVDEKDRRVPKDVVDTIKNQIVGKIEEEINGYKKKISENNAYLKAYENLIRKMNNLGVENKEGIDLLEQVIDRQKKEIVDLQQLIKTRNDALDKVKKNDLLGAQMRLNEFNNLPEDAQLAANARDVITAFTEGTLKLNALDKKIVTSMIGTLAGCNGTTDVRDTLPHFKDMVNTLADTQAVKAVKEQRLAAEKEKSMAKVINRLFPDNS